MNKIRVQAFLLCDSVVVDSQTGKTGVQGVFDRIWCRSFPAMHPNCTLYARLDLGNEDSCEVQLSFRSPSGLRQAPMPPQRISPAPDGTPIANLFIQMQGFPVPEPGRYVFGLIVDGEEIAEFQLTAALVAPQAPQAQGTQHGKIH